MTKYKQIIQLPDKVSQSVFDLPCVESISKFGDGSIRYLLEVWHDMETPPNWPFKIRCYAQAGDCIGEDNKGKWHVLTKEQYKEHVRID